MYAHIRHFRKDTHPEVFGQFLQGIDLVEEGTIPKRCVAVTQVTLLPDEGQDVPLVTGLAFCNYSDQFNKKLGRRIAQGRALKKLERGDWDVEATED